MFLNTLGVGEWVIKSWATHNTEVTEDEKNVKPRGQRFSENSRRPLLIFFENLPKLESHYCRASTTKRYLEPVWMSKSDLYKFYKNNFCKENRVQPVSMTTFAQMFDKQNLSIYQPKKDKCDICVAFETHNLSEAEYTRHIELKKAREIEGQRVIMQRIHGRFAVRLSPKSTVTYLYYKTKLIVSYHKY